MLQKSTFSFLNHLKTNNHKPWFDEHRDDYLQAKSDVEAFVGELLRQLSEIDMAFAEITPASCMFRINRDVRFSKNKAPYKTNFGVHINQGGKKSRLAGFYLHIEPENSFAGGGLWMPEGQVVKQIRQEIDYQTDAFNACLQNQDFKNCFGDLSFEDSLKKTPKGYPEDHPSAPYLKLKSFVAMSPLSDSELQSKQAQQHVMSSFKALRPLILFLNEAIQAVE